MTQSVLVSSETLFRLFRCFGLFCLPKEFSREDIQTLFEKEGKTSDNMRATLSRMVSREMVMKTADGYKKLIE